MPSAELWIFDNMPPRRPCKGSRRPLALPLGELSPQATERVLQAWAAFTLSVFASLRHLSQRERQEGMQRKAILVRISIIKFAREKSRKTEAVFLGALRGFGGKFAIPPNPKPQTSSAFAVWKGRNEHRG